MTGRGSTIHAVLSILVFAAPSVGQSPAEERFEGKIRPLLASKCWSCHGPEKQKGGLRLDSVDAVAEGGESGAILEKGNPEGSRLIEAVRYSADLKMPPKGKLSDAEVADLTRWVREGAPWPVTPATTPAAAKTAPAAGKITPEQRAFWAFQPIPPTDPHRVADPGPERSPIDRLILAELDKNGLKAAPLADKRDLIRRATFDLNGLPPTPDEVDAFLADTSADAFARVVDRLLASPAYGEAWGRHWLDLARYSDSNGMDENVVHANAHHYRDYVVRSFNADKPYDTFLTEQVAGDLMPGPSEDSAGHDRITATGFLVIGPKMLAEDDPVKMEMDIIDEQVDTVGRVFMGLTLGCARCHDHKFDPIPTADYYSMAGIFKSTKTMRNHKVVAMWNERPLTDSALRESLEVHKKRVKESSEKIKAETEMARNQFRDETKSRTVDYIQAALETITALESGGKPAPVEPSARGLNPALVELWTASLNTDPLLRLGSSRGPEPESPEALARRIAGMFEEAAKADEATLAKDPTLAAFRKLIDDPKGPFSVLRGDQIDPYLPTETATALKKGREDLAALEKNAPPVTEVMGVEEQAAKDLPIHIRGSHLTLGEAVPRRFPRVIAGEAQEPIPADRSGRLELARWLTRPDHPLTARVMVNRIWQWHMGDGLVGTPDNFGNLGGRPTHPELLDWLARRFLDSGWSIKAMHRLIMLSATYQRGTRHDDSAAQVDPENRLHWRANRRRLEAESIRDALLAVSGELRQGSPGTLLPTANHAYVNHAGEGGAIPFHQANHRSVYLPIIRSGLYEVFQAFDFADPSTSNGLRIPTTVAPQALFMMNDKLVLRCSEAMAKRLIAREGLDDRGRVAEAYRLAFARRPTEAETGRALAYLDRFGTFLATQPIDPSAKQARSWQALCQALLASSEFLYLD